MKFLFMFGKNEALIEADPNDLPDVIEFQIRHPHIGGHLDVFYGDCQSKIELTRVRQVIPEDTLTVRLNGRKWW